MKRFLWLLLIVATPAFSQTHAFTGFCEQGGVSAAVSGLNSTNKLDGIIPSCTVTVYFSGTTTLAPIYAASTGTGSVAGVTITAGGSYSACPTGVTFTGGSGTGAAGLPVCTGTAITGVLITNGGTGYTSAPTVGFTGGTGSGGTATANLAQTLSNPFTAAALGSVAPGQWLFYAADGTAYDVTMSGGISPLTYNAPVTLTGLIHTAGAGGGGGGGCGPLVGDATSTNCGTNNLASPPTGPAYLQAFGHNNLNTDTGSHVVTAGNGNANTNTYNEVVSIGDTNLTLLVPRLSNTDAVTIGDNNAQNIANGTDLVVIGDKNLQLPSGGNGPTQEVVIAGVNNATGTINTSWLINQLVALGINNYTDIAGIENVAIGDDNLTSSGQNDGHDSNNVAIGSFAMSGINAGGGSNQMNANVAIGEGPMSGAFVSANQNWGANIAIGTNALISVSAGNNLALGEGTDNYNSGAFNIAAGEKAEFGSFPNRGSVQYPHTETVAIGHYALAANTTGNYNVALGGLAGADGYTETGTGSNGNANTAGSNNTWIGYDSGPHVTAQLSNSSALGYQAANDASNQIVLGNASVTQFRVPGIRAATTTSCVQIDVAGNLSNTGAACGSGSGAVNSVTNSDGTLTISPTTGAVVASIALGHANTWTATQTFSGIIDSAISAGTAPICPNGTGGAFTTTGCSGAASGAWSALTNPTGNLGLTMGADTSTFTYSAATGSSDLYALTDTASNTGTGIMLHVHTQSGSTETPFQSDSNGVGWKVAANGSLQGVGTSSNQGITFPTATALPSPTASSAGLYTDTSGNLQESDNGGAFSRICTVGNGLCAAGTNGAQTWLALNGAGGGGTTVNKLACWANTSNLSNFLVNCPTSNLTGTNNNPPIAGVVTSGAGTTGLATVQYQGNVSWICDNTVGVGDWVGPSVTSAGECHDPVISGGVNSEQINENPETNSVMGVVIVANSGAGTAATIALMPHSGYVQQIGKPGQGFAMTSLGSPFTSTSRWTQLPSTASGSTGSAYALSASFPIDLFNSTGYFEINPGISALGASGRDVVFDTLSHGFGFPPNEAIRINASTYNVPNVATVTGTTALDVSSTSGVYEWTLSGNTTLSAPTDDNKGHVLTFDLIQAASGGPFTFSWNAVFLNAPTISTVASSHTMVRFYYDGTNYQCISGCAIVKASAEESVGTVFTVSACGTPTVTGGSSAGTFAAGSTTCNPVITPGYTANNGWTCTLQDETTAAASFRQSAHSTTTATFAGTGVVSSDVIDVMCKAF